MKSRYMLALIIALAAGFYLSGCRPGGSKEKSQEFNPLAELVAMKLYQKTINKNRAKIEEKRLSASKAQNIPYGKLALTDAQKRKIARMIKIQKKLLAKAKRLKGKLDYKSSISDKITSLSVDGIIKSIQKSIKSLEKNETGPKAERILRTVIYEIDKILTSCG